MKKLMMLCVTLILMMMLFQVPLAAAQDVSFLESALDMFDEIETEYRPEVRWWLSSGEGTDETLTSSIEYLQSAGFGGVEILTKGREVTDTDLYGWGSEEWYNDSVLLLEEAAELGMNYSFTSGSDYQPAVPDITPDDEAASAELDFNWAVVSAGETYSGEIPYPTTEQARAGEGSDDASDRAQAFTIQYFQRAVVAKLDGEYVDGDTTYLDTDTLTDVTDLVVETDGVYTIEWTAPDDGNYMLFTFWYHGTGQDVASSNEVMYLVNNFSLAGAQAEIEYLDEYLFTDEVQALIDEINDQGLYVDFFQDSPEVEILKAWKLYWTADLLEEFEERRGYDLTPYLPLIIQYDMGWGVINSLTLEDGQHSWDLPAKFDSSIDDALRLKVYQDYQQTISEMNVENYLEPIKEWLNEKGIRLRTQASYGLFTEVAYAAKVADVVEYEALGGIVVENFAWQSGAAHLYNKNIYSSETAGYGSYVGYAVTLNDFSLITNLQFASGTNRTIFHGYATIATPSEDVGWPGSLGYSNGYLTNWGERHPNGEYLNAFTEYLGRTQKMLRQGQAQIDLGILQLTYNAKGEFDDEMVIELRTSGYTFDYVTPLFLSDDTAVYLNDDITVGLPAYQAFIIFQDHFPYEEALILQEMAEAGLPLVIVEGSGVQSPYNDGMDEEVAAIFEALRELDNVAYVDTMADTMDGLAQLGIEARVSYESEDMYIYLREADDASYVYLYNADDESFEDEVSIEGLYTPYSLDLWTGEVVQIAEYSYEDGRTVIPVSLEDYESGAIVLEPDADEEALTVASTNADEVYFEDGVLYAIVENSGDYSVTMNDGTVYSFSAETFDDIALDEWELTVEQWTAGDAILITEEKEDYTTTEYYYTTDKTDISVGLTELVSWSDIEALGNDVSGIGYYTTTFTLPDDWSEDDGAYLELGDIFETVNVYINGVETENISIYDAQPDITEYLQSGENEILVISTSTLGNYAISIGLMTEGTSSSFFVFSNQRGTIEVAIADYGLIGPVYVVPYKTVVVE